ncbi:hypothetical protein ACYOEI_23960, partial [Singulisphaera rosea]
MIESFGMPLAGPRTVLIALDVALKATTLISLAYGFHWILGRRRALVRSALWNACLVGLLLIPATDLALPRLLITVPTERIIAHEAAPIPEPRPTVGSFPETAPSSTPTPTLIQTPMPMLPP